MTEPWFICNARLPGSPGLWRIGIAGAHIASVQPQDDAGARDLGPSWDAAGRLVSPAFVDPHLHLDKCLQRSKSNASVRSNHARMQHTFCCPFPHQVTASAQTTIQLQLEKRF